MRDDAALLVEAGCCASEVILLEMVSEGCLPLESLSLLKLIVLLLKGRIIYLFETGEHLPHLHLGRQHESIGCQEQVTHHKFTALGSHDLGAICEEPRESEFRRHVELVQHVEFL